MTETKQTNSSAMHQVGNSSDNAVTLRIPKPNMQVILLGFVAFITLFQTFQLVRISGKSESAPVKAVSAPAANSGGGAGSDADTPQSMVGGC